MAVYVGPLPAAPGAMRLQMCFTGIHATLARNLIADVQILSSAALGAFLGLLASFIAGPEVVPQLIGLGLGAAAGAIAGGIISTAVLALGTCPCPPGASGFCISLIFYRVPGTSVIIPIWPFAFHDPAACTTLMPAGCP